VVRGTERDSSCSEMHKYRKENIRNKTKLKNKTLFNRISEYKHKWFACVQQIKDVIPPEDKAATGITFYS
jgi:hypothetical protein